MAKLYAISAIYSTADNLGSGFSYVKRARKCSKCGKLIANATCYTDHERHPAKLVVYFTRARASQVAAELNSTMRSAVLYYGVVEFF